MYNYIRKFYGDKRVICAYEAGLQVLGYTITSKRAFIILRLQTFPPTAQLLPLIAW